MCYHAVVKGLASFWRIEVKELDVLKESLKKAENFRAGGFHFRSKIRRLQSRCAAGK